ncbi:MAG TPA: hypothetical protein VLE70_02465 [Anaerolineae bacterium]|jgi:tetratricopeptide (TPR) repeat protein|nr:hypothetical protein [Anaerolineae bacterium]
MDTTDDRQLKDRVTEPHIPEEQATRQELVKKYRQLLVKDPRNVTLLNDLATAAEEAGEIDRARWAYKRAIRLEPDYAPSYLGLGLLYRREGREGPASDALQKYIQWADDVDELPAALDALENMAGTDQVERSEMLEAAPGRSKLSRAWEELGLTPAEALMLLKPDDVNGGQMMQYTLLDLIARGVLEVDERLRVGRGEHFKGAELSPHEALFAKYFSQISDYVDVDKLAQAALAELGDRSDVFKGAYVRQSLLQKGYLQLQSRRAMGLLPVEEAVPSSKGIRARNRLKRLLKETDNQMTRALVGDPASASAYLEEGGPALLLLDQYDISSFQKWHETLARMGLGPTVDRLGARARRSELGPYIEEALKLLLGD